MESIFIRIDAEKELPKVDGLKICTLQYPNGELIIKKQYFCNNQFKLQNGRKVCKVINWFKRVEVEDTLYDHLLQLKEY